MAKFDKELAALYLKHRTLTSHPRKFEYMREKGGYGIGEQFMGLDLLHSEMTDVAKRFIKMIEDMVNEN